MGDGPFPRGAAAALSLTFDDARESQLDQGLPILNRYGVRATFYVLPWRVRKRLREWHDVAAAGHEIGNHTSTHPVPANHDFSRTSGTMEDFSVRRIAADIRRANKEIAALLGIRAATFAYPYGETAVGRGKGKRSFVPVVARRFVAGRGYRGEMANDPQWCDLAQLDAFHVDELDAGALWGMVEDAVAQRRWVVMVGHEVGDAAKWTVVGDALDELCRRAAQEDYVWVAPVADVARHLRASRQQRKL